MACCARIHRASSGSLYGRCGLHAHGSGASWAILPSLGIFWFKFSHGVACPGWSWVLTVLPATFVGAMELEQRGFESSAWLILMGHSSFKRTPHHRALAARSGGVDFLDFSIDLIMLQ